MTHPSSTRTEKKSSPLIIVYAMILGIVAGYVINTQTASPESALHIAGYFSVISDAFLRLIKMIIAPLVFSTLVVGIAHMGDASSVGRIFAKSLAWFLTASLFSLLLGMTLSNLLEPGYYLHLPLPDSNASANLAQGGFSLNEFVKHLIPQSVIESMAKNEILQIVVFSLFFGIAMSAIGEKNKNLLASIDDLSHIMLKITGYVMKFAPLAVFAAITATIAENGIGIMAQFAIFMVDFYLGLILLWCALIFAGYLFLGKRIKQLL
ncbi:MAG TPA: dicarboxylate/amino acid:cation symporter, partial [Alcaligenaceae bacterium]|nr:dicarboxylate/amino acid:cation symporter [Alcaligenaceae bacterium]